MAETLPTRRGLFRLLAGASALPALAKAGLLEPDYLITRAEVSYAYTTVSLGYAITRKAINSELRLLGYETIPSQWDSLFRKTDV